jgi:AcrR family transcriptional regulator
MTTAALEADLLAAGRRAFAHHGFAGATMERIAAEAGVSRVTLHRRGVTKEAILAALVERAVDDYRAAMWPALTALGSGRDRLEAALDALVDQTEANLDLLLALRSQTDRVFHNPGEEALTRDVFTQPLERLLADGAADGSLRELDAAEAGTVLFNQVGWTYVHLRTGHRWHPERAKRAVLDLALRGVVA